MTEQQKRKQHIRAFMQAHYTDERLAQLLAHAQDGKLTYTSCCCFIGIPTADHPLAELWENGNHYISASVLSGARLAEMAFQNLGYEIYGTHNDWNKIRSRILIPMIRAEMKRRSLVKAEAIADAMIEECVKA